MEPLETKVQQELLAKQEKPVRQAKMEFLAQRVPTADKVKQAKPV
jgi:hypothetical protein